MKIIYECPLCLSKYEEEVKIKDKKVYMFPEYYCANCGFGKMHIINSNDISTNISDLKKK